LNGQEEITTGWPIHYHMKIVCNPAKDLTPIFVHPEKSTETKYVHSEDKLLKTTKEKVAGRYVLISMVFKIVKGDANVTNTDIKESFNEFVHGIEDAWNKRYSLVITDTKKTCCEPLELPILFSFAAVEDTENIHAQLEYDSHKERWHFILVKTNFEGKTAAGTEVRQSTDGTQIVMLPGRCVTSQDPVTKAAKTVCYAKTASYDQNDLEYVYAHEFGHCLGLPDEYTDGEHITSEVQYKKINGKLDSTKIDAPPTYEQKSEKDKDASIMSSRPLFRFHLRHGWCLGIAAKKLINKSRYQIDIIQNKDKIIPKEEGKHQ